MSLLTVGALVSSDDLQHAELFLSSFVLSICSATYGIWTMSAHQDSFTTWNPYSVHRMQLFFAFAIHITYTVVISGYFIGMRIFRLLIVRPTSGPSSHYPY